MSTGAMLVFSGQKLASMAENGLDGVGREVGRSDCDVAKIKGLLQKNISLKMRMRNGKEK